jgi:hypothetical protein
MGTICVISTKHNLRHRVRTYNIPFYHSLDRQRIPVQYDARFKLGPFVGDPSGYENTRTGLTGLRMKLISISAMRFVRPWVPEWGLCF